MVDGQWTPTDDADGRRLDGYTISSPCEPKGSGELIITILNCKLHVFKMKSAMSLLPFRNNYSV